MNKDPKDLEKDLEDYYASANPTPEFLSRLEYGLRSKLKEKEKKKMFGKPAKLKWALSLALVSLLVAAFASPVVAAVKKLFAYIPGIGIVEQNAELRVLAEPVSQTRDGITITINEVVASSENTIAIFQSDAAPYDCEWGFALELKDGSQLSSKAISASGTSDAVSSATVYDYRIEFLPLPVDENEATLIVSCGGNSPNWEFPLRLVPAPADINLNPVTDVAPSSDENPLTITKVVQTETGYILIGEFRSIGLPKGALALGLSDWPQITDASGNEIEYRSPNDLDLFSKTMGVFPWTAELQGKDFDWPLTITFKTLVVEYPEEKIQFDFDAGTNPQVGQAWNLNRDLELLGQSFRLASITRTADGYEFAFDSETETPDFDLNIENSEPTSMSGNSDESGYVLSLSYEDEVPSGKLTVVLSNPRVKINGNWQIQWQP